MRRKMLTQCSGLTVIMLWPQNWAWPQSHHLMEKWFVTQLLFVNSTAYVHNVTDLMNWDIHLEKKNIYIFFLFTLDNIIQQKTFYEILWLQGKISQFFPYKFHTNQIFLNIHSHWFWKVENQKQSNIFYSLSVKRTLYFSHEIQLI